MIPLNLMLLVSNLNVVSLLAILLQSYKVLGIYISLTQCIHRLHMYILLKVKSCFWLIILAYFLFYITVPTPNVAITAPNNNQTVGQSLTLQCEVTAVRGITSIVDIVWSSGDMELQRMNNVSSTMMSNSLVYTNSYTISQLSTTDDGRVIQCEVVINANPEIRANDNYTLDVNG